jgi:hypothetical protein
MSQASGTKRGAGKEAKEGQQRDTEATEQDSFAQLSYVRASMHSFALVSSNMRSYVGEKRKRKLQYLQQLIRDGSNDEHESEPSPDPHDTYARSLSVDYDLAGASQSPYILPSSSDFGPMSSSSTSASYTVAAATSATFDSGHHLAPMHTYVSYPPSWSASVYSPPPPVDVAWTVPSPWMSGMDHSARVAPRPDMYRYTPSPSQPVFEQAHTPSHTPSHEPHVFMSTSDLYGFASTYAPQNQASGSPNVSLPTSSSYYHGHYTGSH